MAGWYPDTICDCGFCDVCIGRPYTSQIPEAVSLYCGGCGKAYPSAEYEEHQVCPECDLGIGREEL